MPETHGGIALSRYIEGNLKELKRKKRDVDVESAGHVLHDVMPINAISLKQLLSWTSTKHSLTWYLGEYLLGRFDGR